MTEPITQPATAAARRIPRRYAMTLVRRGIALWIGARLMVIATVLLAASMSSRAAFTVDDLVSGPANLVPIWTFVMAMAVVFIDLKRRQEISLLSNLGVPTMHAVIVGTIPAALIETVVVLAT